MRHATTVHGTVAAVHADPEGEKLGAVSAAPLR
jgi:hypothetical protein